MFPLLGVPTQPPGLGSRETVPPLSPSLNREREGGEREGGSCSESRAGLTLEYVALLIVKSVCIFHLLVFRGQHVHSTLGASV